MTSSAVDQTMSMMKEVFLLPFSILSAMCPVTATRNTGAGTTQPSPPPPQPATPPPQPATPPPSPKPAFGPESIYWGPVPSTEAAGWGPMPDIGS